MQHDLNADVRNFHCSFFFAQGNYVLKVEYLLAQAAVCQKTAARHDDSSKNKMVPDRPALMIETNDYVIHWTGQEVFTII